MSAKCPLGVCTGGPSSPNYAHRCRSENYEEEDDLRSEGEDVGVLKAKLGARNDEEDERLQLPHSKLARSLRLRAEGFKKVVNAHARTTPSDTSDRLQDVLYSL